MPKMSAPQTRRTCFELVIYELPRTKVFSNRLYIKNLPDKIKKPDLRMALYTLFSTYGPVLDVVVLKTAKMRGQAHIVYRDIQASTQAMRALQGFDFFGKELVSCTSRLQQD